VCVLATIWAATASATPGDRIGHGSVIVHRGERVGDAVALGGSLTVDGWITGDAVAFGGGVHLLPGARVDGDITAFGGSVTVEPGAVALGDRVTHGDDGQRAFRADPPRPSDAGGAGGVVETWWKNVVHRTAEFIRHLAHMFALFFLLVLLGAVMLGVAPLRTRALAAAVAAHPWRSLGLGLLVVVGSAVLVALLAVTVIGIPIAVVLAIALGIAALLGLTGVSILIGELLPVPSLRDRPITKLALGAGLLVLALGIPYIGGVVGVVAVVLGLGSLAFTRMRPGHAVFGLGNTI
jgi:hypothetical protein